MRLGRRRSEPYATFVLSAVRVLGEGVYVWVPYRPPGFSAYGLVYDITREELKERPRYPYGE